MDAGMRGNLRLDPTNAVQLVDEGRIVVAEIHDGFDRIQFGQALLDAVRVGQNVVVSRQKVQWLNA